ncbi:MAG: alpha/beta family hydrolase, partial [Acidobacteriota bacterium]
MSIDKHALSIPVTDEIAVDGLLWRPENAKALLVLAHGAGAGMDHRGMVGLAETLAAHGIASLRYQFPYKQAGRGGPDRPPKLIATVRAAVDAARIAYLRSLQADPESDAAADYALIEYAVFLGVIALSPDIPPDRAERLGRLTAEMIETHWNECTRSNGFRSSLRSA